MRAGGRSIQTVVLSVLLLPTTIAARETTESLSARAPEAYSKREDEQSAQRFAESIGLGQDEPGDLYDMARRAALAGKTGEALDYLAQAVERGYANSEQLKQDADLKALHVDPRWQQLVEKTEANRSTQQRRWSSPALKTPYRENLSDDEKVAGLSRFWSEVKYNFANFDLVPELDWDALYLAYLPKVRQTKTTAEYYRVMMELCARLKDGHTNVYAPPEIYGEFYAYPDVDTQLMEGRVFVTAVDDEQLRKAGVVTGVEVIEINGLPVKQYAAERVRPYQSSSTSQDLDLRTYSNSLFTGSEKEPLEVVFRGTDGRTFKQTLPRLTNAERAEKARQAGEKPNAGPQAGPRYMKFEVRPGNIGYVALTTFEHQEIVEEFAAAFPQIAKTDALIVDIRRNGGGNGDIGYSILSYLTDKPFQTSRWKTLDYRPTFRAWNRPESWYAEPPEVWQPKRDRFYAKPVILLIGPRTFSAGEDFAVAFDFMKRGKIVGEPTGGSTGQPLFLDLPGGGRARVCTKRDTYPDGREFVGVGVQPQMIMRQTVDDLRAGRDTVLEAVLAQLISISRPTNQSTPR